MNMPFGSFDWICEPPHTCAPSIPIRPAGCSLHPIGPADPPRQTRPPAPVQPLLRTAVQRRPAVLDQPVPQLVRLLLNVRCGESSHPLRSIDHRFTAKSNRAHSDRHQVVLEGITTYSPRPETPGRAWAPTAKYHMSAIGEASAMSVSPVQPSVDPNAFILRLSAYPYKIALPSPTDTPSPHRPLRPVAHLRPHPDLPRQPARRRRGPHRAQVPPRRIRRPLGPSDRDHVVVTSAGVHGAIGVIRDTRRAIRWAVFWLCSATRWFAATRRVGRLVFAYLDFQSHNIGAYVSTDSRRRRWYDLSASPSRPGSSSSCSRPRCTSPSTPPCRGPRHSASRRQLHRKYEPRRCSC